MIELLSDVDTKIYILQKYGTLILKLYDVFGNMTIVWVVLTMSHVFLNNMIHHNVNALKYFYFSLFIGFIMDIETKSFLPFIEFITHKNQLALKREYSILTYVFGITTLRDVMDTMMMYIVRTVLMLTFVFIKGFAILVSNEHTRVRKRNIRRIRMWI